MEVHFSSEAEPTVRAIYQRIRSLKATPNLGRPGHRSGTRELALTPLFGRGSATHKLVVIGGTAQPLIEFDFRYNVRELEQKERS